MQTHSPAALAAARRLLDHAYQRALACDDAFADLSGLFEVIDRLSDEPLLISHLASYGFFAFAASLGDSQEAAL